LAVIGYEKASAIAHKASKERLSRKKAALALGYIDERCFEEMVDARRMVGHRLDGS
jgi:fumarate hydratase class II